MQFCVIIDNIHDTVLIETYWNVNIQFGWFTGNVSGINRNILECKYCLCRCSRISFLVLIETYWNVNFISHLSGKYRWIVLIETYWNVNCGFCKLKLCPVFVLIETYWNVN